MNAITADFETLTQTATSVKAGEAVASSTTTRLHPRVLGMTVAVYAALLAAFTFGFAGPLELSISLGIVFTIAAASAILPWFMARQGMKFWANHDKPEAPAGSFRAFLNGNLDTASGKVTGRGAVALVLTVPVCLTLGVTAMAIISRIV